MYKETLKILLALLLVASTAIAAPAQDGAASIATSAAPSPANPPVDPWYNFVYTGEFPQKAAHGAIKGKVIDVQGAVLEPNYKDNDYDLKFFQGGIEHPIRALTISFRGLKPPLGKTLIRKANVFSSVEPSEVSFKEMSFLEPGSGSFFSGGMDTAIKVHLDKPNKQGLVPGYIILRKEQSPPTFLEGYFYAKLIKPPF